VFETKKWEEHKTRIGKMRTQFDTQKAAENPKQRSVRVWY